ncbi:urea ABC transporter ATP-binding protein UrtD [Marinomonas posidonica]|uniref:Urea ABC transporter, ATP-binding protein UrtD n=1 Tax=Marinomonas posidonica (strain CECT 7376 / NCIMB 14433 / IVIA-Po-181) TaxID=491952 RepID=F6CSL6_MARPP|nr:urea ABC transporter ATP-binding protein UrtD [Marinomonas posidonica]AEF56174.1 urea ABC transporter, ATP-binding protein UrtD [Marinomonas posidonica IVIA-Po-181]
MKAIDQSIQGFRETFRRDLVWPFLAPEKITNVDVSNQMILYVEGLNLSFDGFKALNDLNLYIKDGELRCLIGANGAGKTTLMDVITGKTTPDSGSVFFGQTHNLLSKDEADIAQLGIGRKFQKPTVFEEQTVFDNLELSLKTDKRVIQTLFSRLSPTEMDRIDEVLNIIGLKEQCFMKAGALSHGQKQWLEIGMLLVSDPRLLLIDEPVAGMTAQETERTAELLTSLAGERTVIVVEHDMEFVRSIARTVTVLHQGSVLAEGSMDQIQSNQDVIQVYLGEDAMEAEL